MQKKSYFFLLFARQCFSLQYYKLELKKNVYNKNRMQIDDKKKALNHKRKR